MESPVKKKKKKGVGCIIYFMLKEQKIFEEVNKDIKRSSF